MSDAVGGAVAVGLARSQPVAVGYSAGLRRPLVDGDADADEQTGLINLMD